MSEDRKQIVCIGGGFAGVSALLELLKHRKEINAEITLIDPNPFLLFTPSLYEAATNEVYKKNITIPHRQIFGRRIKYINEKVKKIETDTRLIITKGQKIPYDYLILANGSIPTYYDIDGLEKYSIPLKSINDAKVIKDRIKMICCKSGECDKKAKVVIGGGGFSGTELAAELLTYKDKLARQHNLDQDCLHLTVIQGSHRLLKELDVHVSDIADQRLSSPDVHLAFGGHIEKVTDSMVFTDDHKAYPFDLFIWTGGVKANSLARESGLAINHREQAIVDSSLFVSPGIFAAGDVAGFIDPKTERPVPNVAEVAEDQGKIAGENIYRSIVDKPLIQYQFHHTGYIIPLRGRFAAAELMGWLHFDGFLGWILQQLVFLRYLFGILPIHKALKKWSEYETDLQE